MVLESQIRANKKWDSKNRDQVNYLKARSAAKNFIKKRATIDDIAELKELLKEKENSLK